MPTIARVRVGLVGFPGAPGVSTFYALDGPSLLVPLRQLYAQFAFAFPPTVTATVEPTGDLIDAATGNLTGTWTGAATAPVIGATAGAYSAPSGAMCKWITSEVRDGSRVRGRTFMVPLVNFMYDGDGTIETANLESMRASCREFVTAASPNFIVWHRPLTAAQAAARKTPTVAHVGAAVIVVASDVPDKAVVLRSRRD